MPTATDTFFSIMKKGADMNNARYHARNTDLQNKKLEDEIQQLKQTQALREVEAKTRTQQMEQLYKLQQGNYSTPEDYAATLTKMDGRQRRVAGDRIETLDNQGNVINTTPARYGLDAMREAIINYGGVSPAGVAGDLFSNEKANLQAGAMLATGANRTDNARDMMMMRMMMKGMGSGGGGGGSSSAPPVPTGPSMGDALKLVEMWPMLSPEQQAMFQGMMGGNIAAPAKK